VTTACARCGVAHGPWGVHESGDVVAAHHVWVDAAGGLESALTVRAGDPATARRRLAAVLDRFVDEAGPGDLDQPVVTLHVAHDGATGSGPGYGPLGAPPHLLVPLATLLARARADLGA
jgi:hypothetical protein